MSEVRLHVGGFPDSDEEERADDVEPERDGAVRIRPRQQAAHQ